MLMDSNYYLPPDGGYSYDSSLSLAGLAPGDLLLSGSSLNTADLSPPQDSLVRKLPRPQRQKSSTSEPKKHRRTRSGCYTCRQRRVKCDEARPVCDRCRKGKRECTYPDKTTSKGTRTAKSKSPSLDSASSSDEQDVQLATPEETASITSSSRLSRAESRRSVATVEEGRKTDIVLEDLPDWKTYTSDVQFYLRWFQEHMTFCHYAFKHDCRDFLKTSYLEAAIHYKPLLYSVIAFTAYHYALHNNDNKPEKFLDYYDRAVSLFRQSLAKSYSNPVPLLLTMLQLATIEEFLGDWVNLLNHQRAAAKLITDSYTPEEMTQTFTHRVILVWYWRFDLFSGVLSGNPLTLDREWFVAVADSCATAAARNTSGDLGMHFDHFFTTSRLLVTDTTLLFAAQAAGKMSDDIFTEEAVKLWTRMNAHADKVENAFRDPAHFNKRFKAADEDCLTDYSDPHFMFTGEYFTMNYILQDSWSGRLIFSHRLKTLRERGLYKKDEPQLPQDVIQKYVSRMSKMLEAIQYGEGSPAGAVLGLQASLGVLSLFIPDDQRVQDWTRRKLALIETNGYIYPPAWRKWLTELWAVDVDYWWLPSGERLTPMIKSMRKFIDFRAATFGTPDASAVEVRDLRGIFARLGLVGQPDNGFDFAPAVVDA